MGHWRKNELYAERVTGGGHAPGNCTPDRRSACNRIEGGDRDHDRPVEPEALIAHLLSRDAIRQSAAIVSGEEVTRKKPDPEVYERTPARLGPKARGTVGVEDSRNGLIAAAACEIATIVTPSFSSQ